MTVRIWTGLGILVLLAASLSGCKNKPEVSPKNETKSNATKTAKAQPNKQPKVTVPAAKPLKKPNKKPRRKPLPKLASSDSVEFTRPNKALVMTHGIACGDVTHKRAIIWSRANRSAMMHVEIYRKKDNVLVAQKDVAVGKRTNYTGKILVRTLEPHTRYKYDVWFTRRKTTTAKQSGHFLTAPLPEQATTVNFAWSGDLGGQNACRTRKEGYPIFRHIPSPELDFFVGLGDMIYADNTCRHKGRWKQPQWPGLLVKAATIEAYWKAWRYNRGDLGYQRLLRDTSYYAVWDDHEVVNDFGPNHDTRTAPPYVPGQSLMPFGQQAFTDYNPVAKNARDPTRFYRTIRWGKHVEFFVLDTRQYRDQNVQPDAKDQPKTMLGAVQLKWLKKKLKSSTATWKFVISSVPVSIPTGTYPVKHGRDGWANYGGKTGFERELRDVLKHMAKNKLERVIWLTTDVHFAAAFKYQPFLKSKRYKNFAFHEFIVGPMSAMLFPQWSFDKSFGGQRLFMYGAKSGRLVKKWSDAKRWMNFGQINISKSGTLHFDIINGEGQVVYTLKLPAPKKETP